MRMKSWGAVALLAALCIAVAVVLAGTYTASQQVPEFYSQALALETSKAQKASQELGSRVSMLYNEVRRTGRWDALFTAEQINGWLAVDLVENHADLLAPNVHDPRVQIDEGEITLAARIEGEAFSTVFTLTFEPYLYAPNVIAFRIIKARAGLLPIPMTDVLREVSYAVETVGLPLSWTQVDGDPVALVTLIPHGAEGKSVRSLDQLEVHPGEIYLAGRTTPAKGAVAASLADVALFSAKLKQRMARETPALALGNLEQMAKARTKAQSQPAPQKKKPAQTETDLANPPSTNLPGETEAPAPLTALESLAEEYPVVETFAPQDAEEALEQEIIQR